MTKYSSEFKVKLVREWATDGLISYQLAKKYHLSHYYIQYWIEQARLQGITSLQHRRVKRTFSADFKLSVINYY
ncbi:transposase [Limosilactobacillus reuteri]|uniref:transposase n=1 Tax=Limosilactobacillus reuteri TaxID=1598 RepID=UPI002330B982|nr:transposase [Limosilactobacillus reuteri]